MRYVCTYKPLLRLILAWKRIKKLNLSYYLKRKSNFITTMPYPVSADPQIRLHIYHYNNVSFQISTSNSP